MSTDACWSPSSRAYSSFPNLGQASRWENRLRHELHCDVTNGIGSPRLPGVLPGRRHRRSNHNWIFRMSRMSRMSRRLQMNVLVLRLAHTSAQNQHLVLLYPDHPAHPAHPKNYQLLLSLRRLCVWNA